MVATRTTLGHLPWREWKREHRQGILYTVSAVVVVAIAAAFVGLVDHSPRGPAASALGLRMTPAGQDDFSYSALQVQNKLDDQRVLLSEICWERDQSDPSSFWSATIRFAFDASGKQTDRDIVENPGSARPDVTDCVEANLAPITLSPALGEEVTVEASWSLP